MIHEFSSPYTHEQNGTAERDIRTVVECARSMLLCKNVNIELWSEAVNTAFYILNRVLMQAAETKTPYEKLFKCAPKIDHLRVFETLASLHIPKEKQTKFTPKRGKKKIFVGCDGESSNLRL